MRSTQTSGHPNPCLKRSRSRLPKRRKMPNLNLSDDEINKLVVFFKWVDAIDTNEWPPKPMFEEKPITLASKEMPQIALGKKVYEQNRGDLCHKIGDKGGAVGPDLTQVGNQRNPQWL